VVLSLNETEATEVYGMKMEDGPSSWRGEKPPSLDESWWKAVMEEAEEQGTAPTPHLEPTFESRPFQQGDPQDWAWARELYEADDVITLPVVGFNRGGVLVEARSLRGFVPVSHLLTVEPTADETERDAQMESLVDQQLSLKVIEFDPDRGRLVFSERAAQAGPGRRMELLSNLKAGDHVQGNVTNITRFGVFIDLGGVEGLIHVSELSWGRVRHPSDVVHCGESLEVEVLSVDREHDRIALSLKELLPDPWQRVEERYTVGEIVTGRITNVVKFGAFVGIENGLEGLIHISELGDGNFLHPRNVVREGDQVRVRIIHIDADERRLGLSLRNIPPVETEPSEISTSSETTEIYPAG
jgi:small subunit ribosomal protein S1